MTIVYKALQISIFLAVTCISANSHALNIACEINPDTGALQATLPWRNTLGLNADVACNKSVYGRSLVRTSDMSGSSQNLANFVPAQNQSSKEIAYANSSLLTPKHPVSAHGFSFSASSSDKTLVQMVRRWASINGYKMKLNGIYVQSQFPKHDKQYADVPIRKIGQLQETSSLQSALSGVVKKMSSNEFKGLDFQLMADPNTETIYMAINPKS